MALNTGTADALATAICSALGVTDAPSIAKYKQVYELVYSHLKTDILITIAASSIVTTGSATTQTGPAAPIPLSPA